MGTSQYQRFIVIAFNYFFFFFTMPTTTFQLIWNNAGELNIDSINDYEISLFDLHNPICFEILRTFEMRKTKCQNQIHFFHSSFLRIIKTQLYNVNDSHCTKLHFLLKYDFMLRYSFYAKLSYGITYYFV